MNEQNEQNDVVTDMMKKVGVEPTRENYIRWAYFGTPPAQLSAEEEVALPEQFQNLKGQENEPTQAGEQDEQEDSV
jgi:hypothetical protein